MVVKHAWYPTSTDRSPFGLSIRSFLVILRWTNGPIPDRPLKAHSIKRVAFIPSIFTRDVSSSAAGFLAIRVTVSGCIDLSSARAIASSLSWNRQELVVASCCAFLPLLQLDYGFSCRFMYSRLDTSRVHTDILWTDERGSSCKFESVTQRIEGLVGSCFTKVCRKHCCILRVTHISTYLKYIYSFIYTHLAYVWIICILCTFTFQNIL